MRVEDLLTVIEPSAAILSVARGGECVGGSVGSPIHQAPRIAFAPWTATNNGRSRAHYGHTKTSLPNTQAASARPR
jgi:hypothetical protein